MNIPKYKRYENDATHFDPRTKKTIRLNDPKDRRLDQVVENEIVFTFEGKPVGIQKIVNHINKEKLYNGKSGEKVTVEAVKNIVQKFGNNIFYTKPDEICCVSTRMPDKIWEKYFGL